ncbi:hypothetical protein F511_34459 [Dorcoceras hygrometricum]|uniref:Uncharacterized protein n=1 Tax=Dorcoceras hygrometricum TaxID=472368 RepID=A0A2Z7BLK4_9LAMI|nr:hypothetical protein F511_34459 [Dorcoceras hygrometricum]
MQNPMLMLTDYTREMSLRSSSSSSTAYEKGMRRNVLARGVQRYHSRSRRIYLPTAIEMKKTAFDESENDSVGRPFAEMLRLDIVFERLLEADLAVELLLRSFGSQLLVVALIICIAFAYYLMLSLCCLLLLFVLGFDPEVPLGLVFVSCVLFSGFPGFSAVRGFDPAGGAPGGG